MRVILDINHLSMIIGNTQWCNTVEGFIDLMVHHKDDTFEVKESSKEAYFHYMEDHARDNNTVVNEFWLEVDYLPLIHWNLFRSDVLQDEVNEEDYYQEWYEEICWYSYARQMGWE